ncbi:hydrogenase maturation nickel metallochaperone HypA [Motiliproteus sp.]|uniref:hydrogenase maturation nickel metallochaperone HypA n=1 Tax=Motiliproteus sp. TaxID=1898955 RepID=UPI003BAB4E0A
MHEMSLAEGMIQLIEEQARSQQFERVTAVHLEIGRLSNVEVEAMRFCFDAVIRGTLAEGAGLTITETPGIGWCMDCSQSVEHQALYDPCPLCGGYKIQVTGGNQMLIKELEVS